MQRIFQKNNKLNQLGKVRIIGGEWRGRKLTVLDKAGLRPTADRVRETLFNWIQWQIVGSECLDLFAGTGILGIEAFSRGARQVTLIEQDAEIMANLAMQLAQFPKHNITLRQADALHFLADAPVHPVDLVFLDPPFALQLLDPCCELLEQRGWLKSIAHIYMESAVETSLKLPPNWHIIRSQTAGQVKYQLVKREAIDKEN